jgi:hypothetical protein
MTWNSMEVSDQELRALVRDAIARHSSGNGGRPIAPPRPFGAADASHGRFLMLAPSEDGQCVIEPAVRCNHCGYCQSYGH